MTKPRTCVLVVAAHPDDEVLGCGGTIARHVAAGDEVHVVIMAQGTTSRIRQSVTPEELEDAAISAAQILGTQRPVFLRLPDNRMDGLVLLDVVQQLESILEKVRPAIVYTHHMGDLNVDHAITHRAVMTACRPVPGSTVRALYTFETVSSTEWAPGSSASAFVPARFVDISAHLEQKMRALSCYRAELRPFPHARSLENVEALARTRGATVGVTAAEAFGVIRETVT